MLRDRTEEFRRRNSEKQSTSTVNLPSRLEMPESMKKFLNEVEEIYRKFDVIDQKISNVMDLQTIILESNETDRRLFSFYKDIKSGFVDISNKINGLNKAVDVKTFSGSDTEFKICNIQLLTLKRKLSSSVIKYYSIQEEHKMLYRAQVKRQARNAGVSLSETDLDAAMGTRTDMFLKVIIPDYNVAHDYTCAIKRRHEEFLELERSLEELRTLIFDFALVSRLDYSLLHRIDKGSQAVNKIVEECKEGVKLYRAHTRSERIKNFFFIACCGFILVIILFTLASVFIK